MPNDKVIEILSYGGKLPKGFRICSSCWILAYKPEEEDKDGRCPNCKGQDKQT